MIVGAGSLPAHFVVVKEFAMSTLTSDQERQISEFIDANQLIYAIKLYREITGVGLAKAKSAVEAMARGENMNIPARASIPQSNNPLLENRIKELLVKRNKIEAIKIYREAHRVGLKEAKDIIDQMEASMRHERSTMNMSSGSVISNDPFAEDSAGGRMRLVVTVLILLLALGGVVAFFLVRGF
jgi:ribosomal protein L7/L12